MAIIKVNEFLETAFDMEDAEILKEKIMPYIESDEHVLLDFKVVEHFTPLFLTQVYVLFFLILAKKSTII